MTAGARARVTALALALVACAGACASACKRASAGGAGDGALDASAALASSDPTIEALWARAKSGDADDLARLADSEGAAGLAARANIDPAARLAALRAMAYAPEPSMFEGMPLLAEAAGGKSDDEANAALDSVIDLAARPRRAVDPEDATELKQGCDALLALAKDTDPSHPSKGAPRARRVKAIRALRMLSDRGCVDPGSIPTDIDAR